jgi:hypothetical protein
MLNFKLFLPEKNIGKIMGDTASFWKKYDHSIVFWEKLILILLTDIVL